MVSATGYGTVTGDTVGRMGMISFFSSEGRAEKRGKTKEEESVFCFFLGGGGGVFSLMHVGMAICNILRVQPSSGQRGTVV